MKPLCALLLAAGCLFGAGRSAAEDPYNFRTSEAYKNLPLTEREKLDQAHRDFMMLWGALDRYADAHDGNPPDSLDELVPQYLAELPRDPFATLETVSEKDLKSYTPSKDGWGYRYRRGAKGNRAWILDSAGQPTFPYLAPHGNVGLYVAKGVWLSGINPAVIREKPSTENPGNSFSEQWHVPSSLGERSMQSLGRQYRSPPLLDRLPSPSGQDAAEPPAGSLPPDARELIARYEKDKRPIRQEARRKIRELQAPLLKSLKEAQDRCTRDAKLDEAVAIRDYRRRLQESQFAVLRDPGMLYSLNSQAGRTFYFRVTGSPGGPVWGTDIYTTDSNLAAVAVHAGVLKPGQTGIVKVTVLPGQTFYQASERHGISSSSWGGYPASFMVESVGEDDEAEEEESAEDVPAPTSNPTYSPFSFGRGTIFPDVPAMPAPAVPGAPAAAVPEDAAAIPPVGELPDDVRPMVEVVAAQAAAIQNEANRKIFHLQRKLALSLKQLQDNYTRAAKLDEAVAIRDWIRTLPPADGNALPDPGALYRYYHRIGGTFYFRVTGRTQGTVWGTDVYTADSTLAAAAVHAGILKPGETGVVKVTMLPGQNSYQNSTRHGVSSYPFRTFPASYKIESAWDGQPEGDQPEAQPTGETAPKEPVEEKHPFLMP